MKKLTLIVALFGMLLVGFSPAANAGFSLDFGFGIAPAPPPVVVPPPVQTASLPKTAGNLPLMALMGLLSLGAGFSLRALCNR